MIQFIREIGAAFQFAGSLHTRRYLIAVFVLGLLFNLGAWLLLRHTLFREVYLVMFWVGAGPWLFGMYHMLRSARQSGTPRLLP